MSWILCPKTSVFFVFHRDLKIPNFFRIFFPEISVSFPQDSLGWCSHHGGCLGQSSKGGELLGWEMRAPTTLEVLPKNGNYTLNCTLLLTYLHPKVSFEGLFSFSQAYVRWRVFLLLNTFAFNPGQTSHSQALRSQEEAPPA